MMKQIIVCVLTIVMLGIYLPSMVSAEKAVGKSPEKKVDKVVDKKDDSKKEHPKSEPNTAVSETDLNIFIYENNNFQTPLYKGVAESLTFNKTHMFLTFIDVDGENVNIIVNREQVSTILSIKKDKPRSELTLSNGNYQIHIYFSSLEKQKNFLFNLTK